MPDKVPPCNFAEPASAPSGYSYPMNSERNSDTSQVLWFDAIVVLVIAVIAVVANAHPHIGFLIHHSAK